MTDTSLSPRRVALETYAHLPNPAKDEYRRREKVFQRISRAENKSAEMRAIQQENFGRRGMDVKSLERLCTSYRRQGELAFVDCAKCRGSLSCHECKFAELIQVPAATIELWKTLCEQNQRKCKPGWRALIRQWKRWAEGDASAAIPGYKSCPPADINGIPRGWSYGNLMNLRPSNFELTARRVGRSAAANFRPLVFSTRVGLRVGQFYVFDDLEHDIKVNFLGVNRRAMRPLELACLDLYSGSKFAWGARPCMEDEIEDKKIKLKEHEMRFLLAAVLTQYGYLPDGTTLMVEHGTAAIRGATKNVADDLEQILYDASEGKIKVDRSGHEGAAAFAGVFEGRSKGNFRFKAALESHHNLVHNEEAHLPGQMGKDRNSSPEELHGRDRYNERLLKACEVLPPERAALIKFPFLDWNLYFRLLSEIYDEIDQRTEHSLEGWEEAGLIAHEYRLRLDEARWISARQLLALPPAEQAVVKAHISAPGLSRTRRLSPREVFSQGRGALVKLPDYVVPLILGQKFGIERKLGENGVFHFEDRDLGPGDHRYTGVVRTIEGTLESLVDGETYLTHINPFDLRKLFVSDAKGRYIGSAARDEKPCKSDVDGLHRAMGRAAHLESQRLIPLAARGAKLTRERIEMHRHNDRVLSGAPVTAEERSKAVAMREFQPAELLAENESTRQEPEAEPVRFSPESLL